MDIKALWKKHGGSQHGPHVETYSIPETGFWAFIAEALAGRDADRIASAERELTGIADALEQRHKCDACYGTGVDTDRQNPVTFQYSECMVCKGSGYGTA